MRSFNKQNTENLKQERKKSKELRKLRMNNGYTLALIGDEDDKLKGVKFNYNDYYSSLNQEFDEV
jgi:hypothetical protein